MINSLETPNETLPQTVQEQPSRTLIVRTVEEDTGTRAGEIMEEAQLTQDAEFLLHNSPESTLKHSLSPKSRATLQAVIAYLKAPTADQADIKKLSMALGVAWLEERHIPAVSHLHRHFIELQCAHQNRLLAEGLQAEPQLLMEVAATLTELQGLSSRAGLPKNNPLKREYEDFLQTNDMRLRGNSEMPAVSSTDSASVIADVQEFLQSGEQDASIDRALAYLKAPTSNIKDLQKIGDDIGELIAMTYMGEGPPAIEALNTHILRLQFEHELAVLRAAIERQPQNMKDVASSIVLARNLALSSKTTDPTQLSDLEDFLKNFDIKEKSIAAAK